MANSIQQYSETITDIIEDIHVLLNEKYPRVSDLSMLRRKADRLGVMLVADYIKSTVSPKLFSSANKLYYEAEQYLELHRFDLVSRAQ